MLTPLPTTPAPHTPAQPGPPGTVLLPHSLALPQGAAPFAATGPPNNGAEALEGAAARPQSPSAPPLQPPLPAAVSAPSPASVAIGAGALAGAETAAQASTATPMSLVAAQMTMGDTAPLQALLAQQAATRALPVPPRHSAPRLDAPPTPADAAPGDSFDPHAPHLPLTSGAHHGPASPAPPELGDAAPTDDAVEAPHRPPLEALPPWRLDKADTSASPWMLAGAGVFAALAVALLLAV